MTQAVAHNQVPDEALLAYARGKDLLARQQLADAGSWFGEATRLWPSFAAAHFDSGLCSRGQGRLEQALGHYARACELDPLMVEAASNLGSVLLCLRRHDEAQAVFAGLSARHPAVAAFQLNLGAALREAGRAEQARQVLQQLVADHPQDSTAQAALGDVLADLGQADEAVALLRRAVELDPRRRELREQLGHALLLAGRYDAGWVHYEARRHDPRRLRHRFEAPDRFEQPLWDGRPLQGQTLLLTAEDGLGDTLQFARYAGLAAGREARVVLECQPGLQRLLATAPGVHQVVPRGQALPAEFAAHAPLMSLPGILGTELHSVPADTPYVQADPDLARRWGDTLSAAGPALNVGLCWRGSERYTRNEARSVPLATLASLGELPGVRLLNLQRGPGLAQLEDLPRDPFYLLPPLDRGPHKFADSAALMQHLDLVITCDTSVAHLAGALGRPVWLLLCTTPNWRWLLQREDSPWYPAMRLFRQRRPGDWGGVVDRVRQALCRWPKLRGGAR